MESSQIELGPMRSRRGGGSAEWTHPEHAFLGRSQVQGGLRRC